MQLIAIILSTIMISASAFANPTYFVSAGMRQQSADMGAGQDTSGSKSSFQIGVRTQIDWDNTFATVLGLGYTKRILGYRVIDPASVAFQTGGDYELGHIEVPILMKFNLTQYFNPHLGPVIAIHRTSSCSNSNPNNVCPTERMNLVVIPIAVGFTADIANGFSISLAYEFTLNGSGAFAEFAPGIDNYRSVSAALNYTFY